MISVADAENKYCGVYMFIKQILALGLFSLCVACSGPASQQNTNSQAANAEKLEANWYLNPAQSGINYTTIKGGGTAENNYFTRIDGTVSPQGAAEISITLDSLVTNIDTRDSRMKEFVFDTPKFPVASIKTTIDMQGLSGLRKGGQKAYEANIDVSLKYITASFAAQTLVTRLGPNKVLVSSAAPIYVHADDFGLQAGVDKLQELAKLSSITPVVPVSFSLMFER